MVGWKEEKEEEEEQLGFLLQILVFVSVGEGPPEKDTSPKNALLIADDSSFSRALLSKRLGFMDYCRDREQMKKFAKTLRLSPSSFLFLETL